MFASVEISKDVEWNNPHASFAELVTLSAAIPLPKGWDLFSARFNPFTGLNIVIVTHRAFSPVPRVDGARIPSWPIFDTRALAHLTLCEGTRLDA